LGREREPRRGGDCPRHAAGFRGRQSLFGALGDERALFFRQCSVDVQHERINGWAELGDHEGHALRHQAGNERHVARQRVELGDHDRAFALVGVLERRGELRPAVEGIGALAGFRLDALVDML
jgi:hypothetical protein